VKDNINIEKLFKDKFENFEGNVNPDLWTNISQGVISNAAVSSCIGLGVKALIVGMSAIAVGVTVYFVGDFDKVNSQVVENVENTSEILINDKINSGLDTEIVLPVTVIIAEDNDPVIVENKAEIIKELSNSDLDNTVNTVVENTYTDIVNTKSVVTDQAISEAEAILASNEESNTIEEQQKNANTTEGTASSTDVQAKVELVQEELLPTGEIKIVSTESIFQFEFNSNAQNFDKITWSFGDGNFSFERIPTHIFNAIGTYIVELSIESENGKVYTETKQIEIITTAAIDNIANVITPNGDRINDEFVVNAVNVDEFSITITDQLGKTIFKSNVQNFIWNGTDFSGNSVKKAVYNYYIMAKGTDGVILKIPGQLYVR